MNIDLVETQAVYDEVWSILLEISDEIGEEIIHNSYLLKYEGWGGICVEDIRVEVQDNRKKRGVDIDSQDALFKREYACYEFAREQTDKIIEKEWMPEMQQRGCVFIDGGYDSGGLYGRTWALFRKKVNLP